MQNGTIHPSGGLNAGHAGSLAAVVAVKQPQRASTTLVERSVFPEVEPEQT